MLKWLFFGLVFLANVQVFGQQPDDPQNSSPQPPPSAPQPKAVVAPSGADDDSHLPVNNQLAQQVSKTSKASLQVIGEEEGLFIVRSTKKKFPVGTYILFMRAARDRFEMLSRGKVLAQQEDRVLVKLDLASVTKVPYKGDIAISMAPPWIPGKEDSDPPGRGAITTEEPPEPGDPGHIQYDMGSFAGHLDSESSSQVNSYKKVPKYYFGYKHFEWYIEFVWRMGIEYESYTGNFPVFSYYRQEETTTEDYSSLILNYRFRRMLGGYFRPNLRVISFTDEFTTTNKDEAVIPSTYSGFGAGMRWAFEFTSNTWTTKHWFPLALHRIYFDTNYFPMMTAKDLLVSRGNQSKGSSAYEYRVGATALLYLDWFPKWLLLNRFVIDAFYGQRVYDLKFSGSTVSEVGGIYTVPPGGTAKETHSYYVISVGARLDDLIGRFFMPR